MFPDNYAQGQFPVKGLKILLVEDDEICRNVVKKVLTMHGMEIEAVCCGEDALEYLAGCCDIDIILMDIQLPGIDGIEATKKIREMKNLEVPVIALTALAEEWRKEKFFPEGFDDYLSKPVDIDLLFDAIRKQIEHYSDSNR